MNRKRAREILDKLAGMTVAGLSVGKLINTGVSAAVYEATNEAGEKFALKVIDEEFAERLASTAS